MIQKYLENINYIDNEVDIIKIVKIYKYQILNSLINANMDSYIVLNPENNKLFGIDGNKFIGINSELDIKTKRFLIAYEFIYSSFYSKKEKELFAEKHTINNLDTYIERLALDLMLPTNIFIKKTNYYKEKELNKKEIIALLSDYFAIDKENILKKINYLSINLENG